MNTQSLKIAAVEKATSDCAPPLTAKLAPWMGKFLKQPALAQSLIKQFGSPLHIVVAHEFQRNVQDLLSPLAERGLAGGLFFARKANKLPCFVRLAKEAGIGVDTASLNEVKETLAIGLPGERIVVTTIGKGRELVDLSISQGCLLAIDNADELHMVARAAQELGKTAKIGLRFGGYQTAERKVYSRFGFAIEEAHQLVATVASTPALQLDFLHAHLDRYDTDERATAARQLLKVADYATTLGVKVRSIDLGGGVLMRYLDSASQWSDFNHELRQAALGQRPSFTFLEDGLGYVRVENASGSPQLIGKPDLYPAWNSISKERFIAAILDQTEGGKPLYREFQERGMQLYFEPGRALLDNAGITLATVAFRKRDTLGNLLIGMAMNRTNLRPFRAEFCSDPILFSSERRAEATEGAFFVGCLCSESDTIFRRRIALTHLPEPEDIICFANTAGYLAHHLEVGTHGNSLPANILIDSDSFAVQEAHGVGK